jgi:glycosyltransferase involved in cell wall biosynthesis
VKVLHVIPAIAPRYGGPSQAILGMCRALANEGVEVLIATTDADGRHRLQVECGTETSYAGVPTIFFARQWSESFQYSRPLAAWLNANVARFDVVHIHAIFCHPCLAAARAAQRHGVPYIVRPLGTLDPWSLRQKPLRKQLFLRLVGQRMLDGAAAIHYTAEAEKHTVETTLGVDRGVVVPLGVDEQHFVNARDSNLEISKRIAADGPYVLSLGRLHPVKGLELLIQTFLSATDTIDLRHWRLVIVGDGDTAYARHLEQLGRGVDNRVRFTGWLNGKNKMAVLQGASLFAAPSHHENFGVAAVEAMACGVPLLISPHYGLAQEVDAAGAGWISRANASAMTEVLGRALRDSSERARRGLAARELARSRFSWSGVAAQLRQLYADIMAMRAVEHPGIGTQ